MMTIKVTNNEEVIAILADDGYNPFCIPLTLKEAQELNTKLTHVIEKMINDIN